VKWLDLVATPALDWGDKLIMLQLGSAPGEKRSTENQTDDLWDSPRVTCSNVICLRNLGGDQNPETARSRAVAQFEMTAFRRGRTGQ